MKHITLVLCILHIWLPLVAQTIEVKPEWEKHFKEYNLQGSFSLYDLKKDKYLLSDTGAFHKEYLPASTFKIMNALIALESGIAPDENFIIKWDSVVRSNPPWNKDTDLKEGFKNSTVWYYQEIARRIGAERMQYWVSKADYGNRNISGGIDKFWLTGSLRISAAQQLDFLQRLYEGILPFSKRSMDIVKQLMVQEQTDKYILRGKTGWATYESMDMGWYVGYLQTQDNVYFFALNALNADEKNTDNFIKARKEIVTKVFKDMSLM